MPSNKSRRNKRYAHKYTQKKIYSGAEIQNDESELEKLRGYSKKCAENEKVKSYIKRTLGSFIELLKSLGHTDYRQKYSDLTKSYSKKNDYGFVNMEDFDNVINEGNIREQLTMMLILCECFMEIFIEVIQNKNTIQTINHDSTLLKLIKEKLMQYFGFKNIDQLLDFFKQCADCSKEYSMISVSESNVPARYVGFPIKPTRLQRKDDALYTLKVENLYPELSCRETKFFNSRKNIVSGEDPCPKLDEINGLFKSGANYYTINENSSFYKLCKTYDHYIIAGPSGTTDILFHIFGIFNNFDIELFIMSCIAYMGNTPDHSIFEILLPTIAYGSDYDSTMNEYIFIDTLLKKHKNGEK